MIYRILAVLLLMTLFVSMTAAQAQGDAPLIVVIDRDLYAYSLVDDSTTRLTERPTNRKEAFFFDWKDVFPSPDGRYNVYRDIPDYAADAWNNNATGNIGEFPTDLYLIDLTTGEQTTIADHPAGTRWDQGMRYRASHVGTSLAWAPDSSAFAYLESLRDDMGLRLVIYTLASGTNTLAGLNSPYNIQWTPDGIRNGTRLFAADGALLSELALHPDADPDHPVRIAGRDYLIVRSIANSTPGETYLVDLVSGEYFLAIGSISTVSVNMPDTSLVFHDYDNDTRPSGVFTTSGALIEREDGEAPYNVDYVIAPDGQAGAYNEAGEGARGMITFDAEGTLTLHDGMRVVAWGASLFTVSHWGAPAQLKATDAFATPTTCGTLESVLIPGGRGVVLPGSPNRIRSAPSTDGEVIGQIPAGAVFDVLDQPSVCSGGIWWSQVRYEGVEGWTAQGVGHLTYTSSYLGSCVDRRR